MDRSCAGTVIGQPNVQRREEGFLEARSKTRLLRERAQPVKSPAVRRPRFNPWVGKFPWRRAWQPTPVFLPGESHGLRSLAGYSPRGCKESDRLSDFTFTFQRPDKLPSTKRMSPP